MSDCLLTKDVLLPQFFSSLLSGQPNISSHFHVEGMHLLPSTHLNCVAEQVFSRNLFINHQMNWKIHIYLKIPIHQHSELEIEKSCTSNTHYENCFLFGSEFPRIYKFYIMCHSNIVTTMIEKILIMNATWQMR